MQVVPAALPYPTLPYLTLPYLTLPRVQRAEASSAINTAHGADAAEAADPVERANYEELGCDTESDLT